MEELASLPKESHDLAEALKAAQTLLGRPDLATLCCEGSQHSLSNCRERWEEGAFLPRMPESLEKLDLLLIHELRSRRVRPDGIHFNSFRCLSLTLMPYVGEDVTVCFDPRDMGEIRVSNETSSSAEPSRLTCWSDRTLRNIVRARSQRGQELRAIVKSR